LSFILLNLSKVESGSEFEDTWLILNAKYSMQGLLEEYSSPEYAY
jgi:hypothetical protein